MFAVNFEHGQVDPDAFANFEAKIKIGMPEKHIDKENNETDPKGPQLKLSVDSNHMTYTSTSKTLRGSGFRYDPYYATYIGIRNKEDGTMKLVRLAINAP